MTESVDARASSKHAGNVLHDESHRGGSGTDGPGPDARGAGRPARPPSAHGDARRSGRNAATPAPRSKRATALADPVVSLFRSGEITQILGISRRQLQYWAQTDLVCPTVKTQGGHHRYTFQDLVALKAAKRLIDAGISVQGIRKSIRALQRFLPNVERPLSDLVLVATGDAVLLLRDGAAVEAVSGQHWILEVAHLRREVEMWRRRRGRNGRFEPGRGALGEALPTA